MGSMEKISSTRKGKEVLIPSDYLKVGSTLEESSENPEYLVEERCVSENFTNLEIYEIKEGRIEELIVVSNTRLPTGRVLMSFLDNFLEETRLRENEYRTQNRAWWVKDKKAKALKELFKTDFAYFVEENGWDGLRKMIVRLKSAAENPLKISSFLPSYSGYIPNWESDLDKDLRAIERHAIKYTRKHDVHSADEIAVALSLENEDFIKKYRVAKNKITKIANRMESIFSPLFPQIRRK